MGPGVRRTAKARIAGATAGADGPRMQRFRGFGRIWACRWRNQPAIIRVSISHIIVDPTESTRGVGDAAAKSAARNAKKNPIHEHEKSQFTGD